MTKYVLRIVGLAVGLALLMTVREALADFPTEYPEDGGDFPCGDQPANPPTMPNPCVAPEASCTPLLPPPTNWSAGCCRAYGLYQCVQAYWRNQCCRSGSTYFWGHAWKENAPHLSECNTGSGLCE